ncbi:MAG: TIGR03087 family PEP-CTERM/XrtA system glycosyltransferase, partial [Thermogutta sp.]|uniref:TIGR03087 family PEP-CTERM/XrtA system glycosyltransferase n=1 Tax=Thermogutta sp. TaxID=1962930 RepID=UPI00199F1D7B
AQRCDLDVAFLADEPLSTATEEALRARCHNVAWSVIPPWQRWTQAILSLSVGATATQGAFRSSKLAREITSLCRRYRYDVIIVYCSSMVQYIPRNFGKDGVIVDLVDVDSQKWLDYSRTSSRPLGWLYRVEGVRLRRVECRVAALASWVTLATVPERDLYNSFCPHAHTAVVENGVDIDYFFPNFDSREPPIHPRLTFVGALDYPPNRNGVIWFIDKVWPILAQRFSNLEFYIVGAGADGKLKAAVARVPRVFLTGDVPDVRTFLSGAVAIVPLQMARGVQNKVLEAMAMGCATVASSPALEGISAVPGRHVLKADSPEEWINAVAGVIDNPSLRTAIGHAARDYIVRHHTWPEKLKALDELLQL